ncbi:MAG: hypothetical protein MZV64_50525 [Ignavibacteriales bacterium]|nr:hypothetical protein [Ignavibacteriales bacterium]
MTSSAKASISGEPRDSPATRSLSMRWRAVEYLANFSCCTECAEKAVEQRICDLGQEIISHGPA